MIKNWTTNGTAVTDEEGQISFRGFGGTYEVVVNDPETGLSKKQEIAVQELDIQSGIDLWEPSQQRAWTAAMELLQIDGRVVEFFNWVRERTYETV